MFRSSYPFKGVVLVGLALIWASQGWAQGQAAPAAGAAGGLTAKAAVSGACPPPAALKKSADPFCAKTPGRDETVLCNANGTLRNVTIRVVKGAAAAPPSGGSVIIDQKGCVYSPHVVVAVAGQKVFIRNSDPVLHNVHTFLGTATSFNMAMPKGRPDIEKTFAPGVHRFKCDVHPWMSAYLVVSDNPYACVTGDSGGCEIKTLPPGTYTLEAWHEKFGAQSQDVTVAAGPTSANFMFAVK